VEGSIAPSDEALVARCRAGEEEAWNLLVERFSRYVYAICTQGFRFSTHEAEDVFQDVFAKVFEQLSRLRDDSAIRPWIAQLTRRTCIDRLRGGGRETPSEELEPVGLDDKLASLEEAIDVQEALRTLSESCSEILDRFFARDESYKTIADALDLPAGTIASRISRCLDKLRSAMEDRGPVLRPVDG
jgi:RNA polymerase sigma-70 factor (ECF subfamily)